MESRRDTAVRELMHEYKKLDNSHPNNSSKPEMLDQWIKSELDREIIQQAENILSGSFEGSLREELLTLFIEKLDTL